MCPVTKPTSLQIVIAILEKHCTYTIRTRLLERLAQDNEVIQPPNLYLKCYIHVLKLLNFVITYAKRRFRECNFQEVT